MGLCIEVSPASHPHIPNHSPVVEPPRAPREDQQRQGWQQRGGHRQNALSARGADGTGATVHRHGGSLSDAGQHPRVGMTKSHDSISFPGKKG